MLLGVDALLCFVAEAKQARSLVGQAGPLRRFNRRTASGSHSVSLENQPPHVSARLLGLQAARPLAFIRASDRRSSDSDS